MTHLGRMLPDDATVVAALAPLVAPAADRGAVTLASRRPNAYFSSSPSEIVTLDVPGSGRRALFLKYDRAAPDAEPRCRQGVAYCSRVHERVVCRLPLPSVPCLGAVGIGGPPVTVIVSEHLTGALRVNEAPDESGVVAAAEWCGRLHAWGATRRNDPTLSFLVRYDLDYYRAWSRRARALAAAVGFESESFEAICGGFEAGAPRLAAAERTTIHGEFGPQNILWRAGLVYPVDWESAAFGAGAIDLAALLFAWPTETVRRSIDAYWRAREAAVPTGFDAEFAAATAYTALRWLPVPGGRDDPRWLAALARLEAAADMSTG